MSQIAIDQILPLLWAFFAGLVLGGFLFYSSGHRKGFHEAVQQRSREETARAFAKFFNNNIGTGGGQGHGGTNT